MKKTNEIVSLVVVLLFSLILTSSGFLNTPSPLILEKEALQIKPGIKISQKSSGTEWLPGGTLISVFDNFRGFPKICSDGTGGAIISWKTDRGGSDHDIYAQRIDSFGNVQWTPNGVAICTDNISQGQPQMCSDGAGGVIITWQGEGIYAQRVNSTGNVMWAVNGIAVCTASGAQLGPQICSDGAEGAIIVWQDTRSPGSYYDVYAQRIDSSGNGLWTPNGTAICTGSDYQSTPLPQLCSDGAGGAIFTWFDMRSGYGDDNIYAQHINSTGGVQWTPNGTAMCTTTGSQWYPQICSNGEGGAIITWHGGGIIAQLIDSLGNIQWVGNGTAICTVGGKDAQLCYDGAGGAIITWQDYRNGNNWDVYAQHINSVGNVQWSPNGIVLSSRGTHQLNPEICSNGAGGAFIVWDDYSSPTTSDIYAQSINSSGSVQLDTSAKAICTEINSQFDSQICSDGASGAIITWGDQRSGDEYHIYAQHINYNPTTPENGVVPFEIIIFVSSFVGIAVVIGIATTLIIKKRRKIV